MSEELVFFLEGRSEEGMLRGLLPKILPDEIRPTLVIFEGKQDLKKQLPIKIKGWTRPCLGFVVLQDQDGADCVVEKNKLKEICEKSGAKSYIVRIACHELESWYLGDLKSVSLALGIPNLEKFQNKKKYRNPDALGNPTEELKKITNHVYQKANSSRKIGAYLFDRIHENTSQSFKVFISGVQSFIQSQKEE